MTKENLEKIVNTEEKESEINDKRLSDISEEVRKFAEEFIEEYKKGYEKSSKQHIKKYIIRKIFTKSTKENKEPNWEIVNSEVKEFVEIFEKECINYNIEWKWPIFYERQKQFALESIIYYLFHVGSSVEYWLIGHGTKKEKWLKYLINYLYNYPDIQEIDIIKNKSNVIKYGLNLKNKKGRHVFRMANSGMWTPQFYFLDELLKKSEEDEYKEQIYECLFQQIRLCIDKREGLIFEFHQDPRKEEEFMRRYEINLEILIKLLETKPKDKKFYKIMERIVGNEKEIEKYSEFFNIIKNKEKIDKNIEKPIDDLLNIYYSKEKNQIFNKHSNVIKYKKHEYPLMIVAQGEIETLDELNELLEFNIEGYIPISKIGEGGIRKVYKVISKEHNEDIFALKLNMPLEEIKNQNAKRVLNLHNLKELSKTEVNALKDLTHENLARMWNYGEFQGRQYIVEEYVGGMTLEDLVKEKGKLDNYEMGLIFYPLAKALRYLHEEKGYVHRDIKPNNILISKDFSTVKLIDLQTARKMNEIGEYNGFSFGTEKTAAPEVLHGGKATKYSDMYALGSTMFYAMTGEYFDCNDTGDFSKEIKDGKIKFNGKTSENTIELIKEINNFLEQRYQMYIKSERESIYQQQQLLIFKLLNNEPEKRFIDFKYLKRHYQISKSLQDAIKKGLNPKEIEKKIVANDPVNYLSLGFKGIEKEE